MVINHTAIRVCRELIEDLDCNCFMSVLLLLIGSDNSSESY